MFRATAILTLSIPSLWFAWNFRDMPHLGSFQDDGLYLASAKSLAEGSGYRIASLPGQPWQTKFPILYPLALAQFWKLRPSFPSNTPLLMLFAWIWLPIYLLLSRSVFITLGFSEKPAWVCCAFLAVNPNVILFGISLMSELMFSCLLLGALLLIGRGWRLTAVAGVLGGLAYLTRSAALPLLLTGPLLLLIRKQGREAAVFVATMLPAVIAWNLWVHVHFRPASDPIAAFYTDYFGYYLRNVGLRDLPIYVIHNFACLLNSIGNLFALNTGNSFWQNAAISLLGAIAIAGCIRKTHFHLFAAVYSLVLLFWHYTPTERFLIPLFPILLGGLAFEIRRLGARLRGRSKWLGITALTFLAIYWTDRGTRQYLLANLREARVNVSENRRVYDWIAANVPTDAKFISGDDAAIYLYTGRHAISYQFPPKLFYRSDEGQTREFFASLSDYARTRRIDYIVAGASRSIADLPTREKTLAEEFLRGSSEIECIHREAHATVWRLKDRAVPE